MEAPIASVSDCTRGGQRTVTLTAAHMRARVHIHAQKAFWLQLLIHSAWSAVAAGLR